MHFAYTVNVTVVFLHAFHVYTYIQLYIYIYKTPDVFVENCKPIIMLIMKKKQCVKVGITNKT